nr:MAG TPA: hypothetical protein [Caudoviricetes sp.]
MFYATNIAYFLHKTHISTTIFYLNIEYTHCFLILFSFNSIQTIIK